MTTPNAQHEIAQLTRMAMDPQFTVAERAAALLIAHQRRDAGSCICGWDELGKSHAAHQADVLAAAGLLATSDPASGGIVLGPIARYLSGDGCVIQPHARPVGERCADGGELCTNPACPCRTHPEELVTTTPRWQHLDHRIIGDRVVVWHWPATEEGFCVASGRAVRYEAGDRCLAHAAADQPCIAALRWPPQCEHQHLSPNHPYPHCSECGQTAEDVTDQVHAMVHARPAGETED